ncbi:hypothetical protein D3C81_528360 [compost metagenome]
MSVRRKRGDIVELDGTTGGAGHRLFALCQIDSGTSQGPVAGGRAPLGSLTCAGSLVTQAEQAVLVGGQAEAWQAQGVDLLLGQVWRQLLVQHDDRSQARARSSGVHAAGTSCRTRAVRPFYAVRDTAGSGNRDSTASLDY